jgi:hypothetical protein
MPEAISSVNETPPKPKLPDPETRPQGYLSEPGETPEDIARDRGIPIEKLLEANPGLSANWMPPNQFVNIPEVDQTSNDPAAVSNISTSALAFANTGGVANDTNTTSASTSALTSANGVNTGAPGEPTLIASSYTATSPDQAAKLRTQTADQLRLESKLNQAKDPKYGNDLNTSAANIANGSAALPKGTYRATAPQQNRLASGINNPLEVDRFSGDPVARINQYTNDIDKTRKALREEMELSALSADPDSLRGPSHRERELSGQLKKLEGERDKFINDARLQSSRGENGKMYQALGNPADKDKTPVIFINGVNTDASRSAGQALELSNEFRAPVNHVVNVSSMDKLRSAGIGIVGSTSLNANDADLRIQQQLTGNRPAATTAANAILDQMYDPKLRAANAPIKMVGYSQGAAIGAQALRDVDSHLTRQVQAGKLTQQEKVDMLSRVRFLGIGPGAAERHLSQQYVRNADGSNSRVSVPDLRNVKYRTVADKEDPIAALVGVGKDKVDLGTTVWAGSQLAGGHIGQHLTYFKQYENTDPGTTYNSRMHTELNNWYSGKTVTGTQTIDYRKPGGI